MADGFRTNDSVEWDWGKGTASATVVEVLPRRVTRTIKGKRIRRNGSARCPALVLKQEDGGTVLKLASEVRRA